MILNLNILLRGQSNAVILGELGGAAGLEAQVEALLGFDGVTDTVTLRFEWLDPNNRNTAVGGTALIGDWLDPVTVNGQVTWQVDTLQQGLLDYIAALPAAARAEPTVVLWLHNEYDSSNAGLTAATWTSAVRFDAGLVRAAFGSAVPYVFVEPIPYVSGTDAGAQAIRVGMSELVADQAFNARLTASNDDLSMDADVFGGGGHMNQTDAATVAARAARSIAESFAAYAKPGSPLAAGNIDDSGPIAIQAQQTGPRQVTVTLQLDGATGLQALDADAATGLGWTARLGSQVLNATGVTLGTGNTLVVTFGADLPSGAVLHYGYGNTQLLGSNSMATGNAIYDDQGMPLSTPAQGLVIDGAPTAPGVVQTGTTNDDALNAGPNGDTLIGGKGNDYLTGGAGADQFQFALGDGNDWIIGFTPGTDRIKFGVGVTAADVTTFEFAVGDTAGLGITYGSGGDGIFLAGVSALGANDLVFTPPPVAPPTVQTGTPGDDALQAGGSGDTIIGGKGNDYLIAGAGADQFQFALGDGNDFVQDFKPGTDTIRFGPGIAASDVRTEAFTLLGVDGLAVYYGPNGDGFFLAGVAALGAGDLIFAPPVVEPPTTRTGTPGDDALAAGPAGDTIIGGKGNDYLIAGAGADQFQFAVGDGNDFVQDFKPGTDTIRFGPGITAANVRTEAFTLAGVDGLAVYYGPNGDGFFLAGVTALGANDLIFAPPVVEPPVIRTGTPGNDALAAGPAGDTVIGGKGNDYLIGNAGNDVFGFALGDGPDWIDGFTPGADKLLLASGLTAADVTVTADSFLGVPGVFVGYGNQGDFVFVANVAALQPGDITFGPLPTVPEPPPPPPPPPVFTIIRNGVTTTEQAATYAGPIAGLLYQFLGTAGAESVAGTAMADFLSLGAGNDLASGGAGNDRLDGGAGRDVLVYSGSRTSVTLTRTSDKGWVIGGAEGTDTVYGFEAIRFTDGDRSLEMASRDLMGSGTSALLFQHTSGTVALWSVENGQVTASVGMGALAPGWSVAGTGDFNGDATTDVLFRYTDGTMAIWRVDNGVAVSATGLGAPGEGWSVAGIGDVNGDGTQDILFRHAGGTIAAWQMQDGQVTAATALGATSDAFTILGMADLDGDGTDDLLFGGTDGTIAAWTVQDGVAVAGLSLGALAAGWSFVGTGDLDADGAPDLLFQFSDGMLAAWMTENGQVTSAVGLGRPDAGWSFTGTGDYNGDGTTDLLFLHGPSGLYATWEVQDGQVVAAKALGSAAADWTLV